MVFCLDYDGTFTGDPELWTAWAKLAQERGHKIVCITGRRELFESRKEITEALPEGIPLYFAYDKPKMQLADEVGLCIDVWIDDWPGLISG